MDSDRRSGAAALRRSERGASTPEYVAVLVVVGAMIAALWAVPLAPYVGEWARHAACSLFNGDCGEPPSAAGVAPVPAPVSMACLEGSDREQVGGSVTLFSVKGSGDLAYQVDRNSDGTHDVTLELSAGLAGELMAGGKLSADALGVRQGRQGAVELGGDVTVAPVFTFDSQDEAVVFADRARDLVTGPMDDTFNWRTLIPVYGPMRIPANQAGRVRDFDPPPASRLRVEGQVGLEASGSLYGSAGGAHGVLSAGRTLGADLDLASGETTLYVALDGEVAARLGLGPSTVPAGGGIGGTGSLSHETTVALTIDESLRPTKLQLGQTVSGHGGLQGGLDGLLFTGSNFGTLQPDLDAALASMDVNRRDELSAALSATASLDLTDPRVHELGMDVITALGSQEDGALADAGRRLGSHLAHDTDLEAQLHVGSRTLMDVSASGGKGLAFGFGASHQESSRELAGAWMRPAGGSFQRGYCA